MDRLNRSFCIQAFFPLKTMTRHCSHSKDRATACCVHPGSACHIHLRLAYWQLSTSLFDPFLPYREKDVYVIMIPRHPTRKHRTSRRTILWTIFFVLFAVAWWRNEATMKGVTVVEMTFLKPLVKRIIGKIYYLQMESSRSQYMEEWLGNQTKVPYQAIVPSQPVPPDGDEWDWMEIYLQVAGAIQTDLQHSTTPTTEPLALILLDDYKLKAVQSTLERVEKALPLVPNTFDIVRLDCFRHGSVVVSSENQVQVLESSSANGWMTPRGGWHAMLWRTSRLDRIKIALELGRRDKASMECLLTKDTIAPIKSYCLDWDNNNPIGCFHHLHADADKWPIVESKSSGNVCGLHALPPPADKPKAASISEDSTTFQVNVAGKEYTYRAVIPPFDQEETVSSPRLLFGITSMGDNFVRRQAIRQTWGAQSWRTVFIVAGRNFDAIEQEFRDFQDLIWLDIDEHYKYALTPKTMTFLHYANQIIKDGMYALKTDDDMFFNVKQLRKELSNSTIDYYGYKKVGLHPDRGSTTKWRTTKKEFPGDIFPPYATGAGYVVSSRFIRCAAQQMPTLLGLGTMWWEDIAVGLLAEACKIYCTHSYWDPTVLVVPGQYFMRGKGAENRIVHRVSIENQFRLFQGLSWVFDEDRYKVQRECPGSKPTAWAIHDEYELMFDVAAD